MQALVGYSGFVGSSLLRQAEFGATFRSTDIAGIRNGQFDTVVCAGVPAMKWVAERDPDADIANIRGLFDHLSTVDAGQFVLISTVDVFPDSRGKDEDDAPDESLLTAYGRNRLWLERAVRDRFPNALIVRLPGLVGPGLRKNAIFDFRNDNSLHLIDSRGVFNFYPMVRLWGDIQAALAAGLKLVHLTAAPLSIREVAQTAFGLDFTNVVADRQPASYDLQTRHAALFGGAGCHTYSARECMLAIQAYAQSEPPSKPIA